MTRASCRRVAAFACLSIVWWTSAPAAGRGRSAPQAAGAGDRPAASATAEERGPRATTDDFRYERYARPGGPGPNRLPVDLPLLAGASPFAVVRTASVDGEEASVAQGGLADLRFFDQSGREVPYLVVQPAPRTPDYVRAQLLSIAPTKKTSGFEADLGSMLLVDRLRVRGLPAPYLKRVRLEGSGDRAHWTLLAPEATLFDLPEEHLGRNEIEFPAGEYRYLRLIWDDASSARVPLPRACDARRVTPMAAHGDLRAPIAFERRASEPGVSRYRLLLPAPRLPAVAVELSVGGGHLLRQARVTESRLDGGQMSPVTLGTATLRRAVRQDLAAAELRIPIRPPSEGQIDLVVEDGSNAPLDLAGVSVVFAELPWIYFEAASAEPLLARFGASRAAPPRYDLEAMRPSVGRVKIAQATWGARLDLEPRAGQVAEAALPMTGAPLDESTFRYRRRIPPGDGGLAALRLDAAALAHGRFSDLRISTHDGRQVPYLVERLEEPLSVDLPSLELETPPEVERSLPAAVGSRSVYRLRLPHESLPASRLVLSTPARVFIREVRVIVEREAGTRDSRRVDVEAAASWRHAEPETSAPPLTISLPASHGGRAWLVVDEGDNSRLPLGRPELLLPAYRLRFFRTAGAELTLLYGNSEAAAPRYDLALLEPRLVGAAAREVWPEREASTALPARAVTATRVFWGALVAAVLVLVALLARLLKPGQA